MVLKKTLTETLKLVLLLLASSIIIFFLIALSPIDPITSNYGQNLTSKMTPEKLESLKNYWGVGKPVFERFLSWLTSIVKLDFGQSLIYNEPVLDVILRGLKNSAPIMLISWIASGVIGYLSAILVAFGEKSYHAKFIKLINYCLVSTPTYLIAILFLSVFSISLRWISTTSTPSVQSSILPCVVLIMFGAPTIFFHTLSKLKDVLNSDYVKHAKNKGLTDAEIVKRHVLKNVSLPALTIEFAQIGEIIGGSVVVEQVFSYPGLGLITMRAATSSDVCLLAGISFITCLIVFFGNLVCKIIINKIDPRTI